MKHRKISDICSRKRPPQGSWNINNSNVSFYNHLSMPVHLLQYIKGVANLWKPIMIYWHIWVHPDFFPHLPPLPSPPTPLNCKKTKNGGCRANWTETTCSRWQHLSSSSSSQNNPFSIIPNCREWFTSSAWVWPQLGKWRGRRKALVSAMSQLGRIAVSSMVYPSPASAPGI